jgi:4-amino-4-deoxy-L-arabinose transferase-like glycosyltransferase
VSETKSAPKPWLRLPERIGVEDHLVGLAMCVFYISWLLRTERTLGFSRDEGFYFHASSQYQRWFEALFTQGTSVAMQQSFIDPIWSANHEHPGLMKSLFALSHYYFFDRWHLFQDQSTAYRFPGMMMAGVALWVIYLWGARAWSRRAGVFAALAFALMPRVFYHAHLACFDIGITSMWLLCLYVYWRSIGRGWGWAILLGIVFGLALDTKHNAWERIRAFTAKKVMTNRARVPKG